MHLYNSAENCVKQKTMFYFYFFKILGTEYNDFVDPSVGYHYYI